MAIYFKYGKRDGECKDCGCPEDVCDPCCDPPLIKYDSVAVEKSKCGYQEFTDETHPPSSPPKYYLNRSYSRNRSTSYSSSRSGLECYEQGEGHNSQSSSAHSSESVESHVDPETCAEIVDSSDASSDCTVEVTNTWNTEENESLSESSLTTIDAYDGCGGHNIREGSCIYCETEEHHQPPEVVSNTLTHTLKTSTHSNDFSCSLEDEVGCFTDSCSTMWSHSESEAISNEYTKDALVANAETALAEKVFPETWGGSVSSSRDVSSTEETVSLVHTKAKFYALAPLPETERVLISYKLVFTPESGGAALETSGSTSIEPGDSESEEIDIPVPDSEGSTILELVEATCETVD